MSFYILWAQLTWIKLFAEPGVLSPYNQVAQDPFRLYQWRVLRVLLAAAVNRIGDLKNSL